jgi:hypothetical protein
MGRLTNLIQHLYYRIHPRRFKKYRRNTLLTPSIIFTDQIDRNTAQIKWCWERCRYCYSLFTVTIMKDDIPLATKCMIGHNTLGDTTVHLWREGEIKKFKETGHM